MALSFLPLTPDFVREHLDRLVAISADVSPWRGAEFFAELPAKWDLSFAQCLGGELTGYCVQSRKFGPPHIHQFMISPALRRRGFGSMMLREAIGRGATTLNVDRTNEGAIRFYRRHGWADLRDVGQYLWMRWGDPHIGGLDERENEHGAKIQLRPRFAIGSSYRASGRATRSGNPNPSAPLTKFRS